MRAGSVARSQALLLLSLAGRLGFGLGITAVLGRSLAPAGLGFVTLVGTIFSVAQSFLDLGMARVAVREIARDPSMERSLLGGLVAWRALCGAALALMLLGLAGLEAEGGRRTVLAGAALVVLLSGLDAVRPAFVARQVMEGPVAVTLLGSSLVFAGCLALAARGASDAAFAWLLVLREGLSPVLIWILATRLLGYRPRPGFRARRFRPFLAATLVYGGAVVIHQTYFYADVFLVRLLRGGVELGAYAAAFRPMGPLMQVPQLLMGPLLPLLAAGLLIRGRDSDPLSWDVAAVFAAVGALAGAAGIGFGRDFLALLYGGRYLEGPVASVTALEWLSVALAASCAAAPFVTALLAAGRERSLLALAVLGLAAKLTANVILLPRWGFVAAAASTAATEVALAGAAAFVFRRASRPPTLEATDLLLGLPSVVLLAAARFPGGSPLVRAAACTLLFGVGLAALVAAGRGRRLVSRLSVPSPRP